LLDSDGVIDQVEHLGLAAAEVFEEGAIDGRILLRYVEFRLVVTNVCHNFATVLFSLEGIDRVYGQLDRIEEILEALPEGNSRIGHEVLLVLEKGEVEDVDDEMSEEDNVMAAMNVQLLI
jgi:hypothetical protein